MRITPKRRRCSLSLNPTTPGEPGTWYGFKLALSLPNQRHLLGADALLRALDHISFFEPQPGQSPLVGVTTATTCRELVFARKYFA
jgi:hypothetical protein